MEEVSVGSKDIIVDEDQGGIFDGNRDIFTEEAERGDGLVEDKDSVVPYLRLAPPASPQQTIEFSQVLKLPLSRSFRTLFKNIYDAEHPNGVQAQALAETAEYTQQNVRFIDLRPKRWYRELAKLARGFALLNSKLAPLNRDINDLEAKLQATALVERIGEGENKDNGKIIFDKYQALYYQTVTELEKIKAAITACEQQRDKIIREIYQSGYTYHPKLEEDKNKDAKGKEEMGARTKETSDTNELLNPVKYGIFRPFGTDLTSKDYLPFLKDEDFLKKNDDGSIVERDVAIDEDWKFLSGKLSDELLTKHNDLLSAEKGARFRSEIRSLESQEANLTIMSTIQKYKTDIAALQDEIQKLDGLINQANAEVQAGKDIDDKIATYTQRQSYYSSLVTNGQADLNNKDAALRAWFRQKGAKDAGIIDYAKWALRTNNIANVDAAFKALFYDANLNDARVINSFKRGQFYDAVVGLRAVKKAIDDNTAQKADAEQQLIDLRDKDAKKKESERIMGESTERKATCESQLASLQEALAEYEKKALPDARNQFINEWNDSKNYDYQLTENYVDENVDPLKDFYAEANKKFGYRNVYRFKSSQGAFFTDNDLSLPEFMSMPGVNKTAVIIPCVDKRGVPSKELFWGVLSPQLPSTDSPPKLPVVKVVETNLLEIEWIGYSLSALAEAVNLFPGEKKQIIVEKRTKLTRTVNQSVKSSQEEQRHLTSSFEENLRSELSTQVNVTNSDQQTKKSEQSQSGNEKSGSESGTQQQNESSVSASAHASFFDSFSADANGSDTRTNTKTASQSQSKEAAYSLSQSNEGQTLNKTTRDVAAKNLSNTVSKVSSETSSNNKLEIASSSTEQYEESTSNKESMQIENPNLGCTVNYNFHQIQNVYGLRAHLHDAKIVIDTGILILEGVDITVKIVCELEEFNKLFKQLPSSNSATLLCAFVARRVLKNYSDMLSDPVNQGVLKLKIGRWGNEVDAISKIRRIYRQLNMVLEDLGREPFGNAAKNREEAKRKFMDSLGEKIKMLESALRDLQKFSFILDKTLVTHESKQVVNAPAYHVDTQIGQLPAVESYLVDRRKAQLDTKSAKSKLIRAKAKHKLNTWMQFHVEKVDKKPIEDAPGDKSQARSLVFGAGSGDQ